MNKDTARQLLTTAFVQSLQSAGITWAVQYENRNLIDTSTQVEPFIVFEVDFGPSEQIDIGTPPKIRTVGAVSICLCVKEGQGTSGAIQIADLLEDRLGVKDFGAVRTKALSQRYPIPKKGWYCLPLYLPFWFDRVANSVN